MTASASAALAEPTPMGIPLVDRKLVKAWFTGTLFWVVVGPVLGLIASMKLDDPYFLANIEWLQFARLRIAPFIATLAMLLALRGLTIAIFGEETVPLIDGAARSVAVSD